MDPQAADHRFQVSLEGLIDLLANHLYETPAVFVRELLQNAVDAVEARRVQEPDMGPEIRVELLAGGTSSPTVTFTDNGVGLTEAQVHEFLATIGQSAKRGALPERSGGYLGQFGVGLLSCFVVADEIVLLTRSLEAGQPSLEWVGRMDGSYTVKVLETSLPVGSTVFLRLREEASKTFDGKRILGLLRHYGEFLHVPVIWCEGDDFKPIQSGPRPWQEVRRGESGAEAVREFATTHFGFDPLDAFEIRSKSAGIRGVAYVQSQEVSLTAEVNHRVYLRGMLLSDSVSELLPRWATFLRCSLETDLLRPTASREALHKGELLEVAREELARSIRSTIVRLAESDPSRIGRWIAVHGRAMKALACSDNELYRTIVPYLHFVTNRGSMSLVEILDVDKVVSYCSTVDVFRQVAGFAAGVDELVVNGGYEFDRELLERLDLYDHEVLLRRTTLRDFASNFRDPVRPELGERLEALGALAIGPFDCGIEVKGFAPAELPALYSVDPEALAQGDLNRAAEEADELFGSILGALPAASEDSRPVLYLNADNRIVEGLATAPEAKAVTALQVLFVHALLQAQQPLGLRERRILEDGLLELIGGGLGPANGGGAAT